MVESMAMQKEEAMVNGAEETSSSHTNDQTMIYNGNDNEMAEKPHGLPLSSDEKNNLPLSGDDEDTHDYPTGAILVMTLAATTLVYFLVMLDASIVATVCSNPNP
jgi:hypothetical protein